MASKAGWAEIGLGLLNVIHLTAGRMRVMFPFKDVKKFPDVFYRAQCFGFGVPFDGVKDHSNLCSTCYVS
jgi:hypothetical protein